jgi:hypothetical protein
MGGSSPDGQCRTRRPVPFSYAEGGRNGCARVEVAGEHAVRINSSRGRSTHRVAVPDVRFLSLSAEA